VDQIESCISFQIGKAAQQVSRRAKELLAPYGVTPVQYAVLKCLHESAGMSGVELGSRLVLDSASITGVVDRLVALALVERRADAVDRRIQRLYLTHKSAARQAALDAAMDTLNAEAAHILGAAGKGLSRQLRKLGDRTNWRGDV